MTEGAKTRKGDTEMTEKTTYEKGGKLMKKTLSLILAVLMIVATMPMAFAATELTTANIVELPTIEGEIFYGQTIAESTLKLVGGKVTTDGTAEGTIVEGTFEFIDTTIRPTNGDVAQIKFVPENEMYVGFDVLESSVTIPVSRTTPIYVSLPVPDKAAAIGRRLSTIKLTTNDLLINPYTGEEIPNSKWVWNKTSEKVSQPGFFNVKTAYSSENVLNYTARVESVWVSIEGVEDSLVPQIKENPTTKYTVRCDPNKTWGEVELEGGIAVVYDADGNEIIAKGTFAVADVYKDMPISKVGDINLPVQFISEDESVAISLPFNMIVTVLKAAPAWTSGETVITVPYGTEIDSSFDWYLNNELDTALKDMLKSWSYKTIDGAEITGDFVPTVGTHEVTANLNLNGTGSQNWQTDTMMTFTLVVEATVLNCEITHAYGGNKIVDNSLAYDAVTPTGTFTIVGKNGDEIVFEKTVKYGEIFKLNESTSGKYVYSVKYNPVENDAFIIADFVAERDITLKWNATIDGKITEYAFGDTVEARTVNTTDFTGWTATDANGNPVELTLVSGTMENDTFTFIMPDHNVIITPEFGAADDNGGGILDGIGDIDGIDGAFDWILNLLNKIKAFFEKIIAFFQGIGDMT